MLLLLCLLTSTNAVPLRLGAEGSEKSPYIEHHNSDICAPCRLSPLPKAARCHWSDSPVARARQSSRTWDGKTTILPQYLPLVAIYCDLLKNYPPFSEACISSAFLRLSVPTSHTCDIPVSNICISLGIQVRVNCGNSPEIHGQPLANQENNERKSSVWNSCFMHEKRRRSMWTKTGVDKLQSECSLLYEHS